MPFTLGDSFDPPLAHRPGRGRRPPVTEYLHPPADDVAERIARYVAGIIEDGSTLQVGLGRIPNEMLRYLTTARDLGIHSDVITDGVLDLIENGRRHRAPQDPPPRPGRRQLLPRHRAGSTTLIDRNPLFEFQPIEYVCDPAVIAAQPPHGLGHAGLRRSTSRARSASTSSRASSTAASRRSRTSCAARRARRAASRSSACAPPPRTAARSPHPAAAAPGRGGGHPALRRALRGHRVRHGLPLRQVDPRAGPLADRDRAPALPAGGCSRRRSGSATSRRPRPSRT